MKQWHVVVLGWSIQTDVFQQCLKIDLGHTHATAAILSNWLHVSVIIVIIVVIVLIYHDLG